MRTALTLVLFLLVAISSPSEPQMLARLTGTPLDVPEIWGSGGRQYIAVSSDEQWIAYIYSGFPPEPILYLKPLHGGEERLVYYYNQFAEQLKNDPNFNDPEHPLALYNSINSVSFTPDSKEITFEVDIFDSTLGSTWQFKYDVNGHYAGMSGSNVVPYIKSYTIETGKIRDITTGSGWGLEWDPTGNYLFIPYNWDERLIQAGLSPTYGNSPAILNFQTGEKWPIDNSGIFSRDGQHLLYWKKASETPTSQLFSASIFGGEPEQVASMTETNLTGAGPCLLSPDGKWLFFAKHTSLKAVVDLNRDTNAHINGTYTIYASTVCVMDMETRQIRDLFPLTDNLELVPISISADGKTVYIDVFDHLLDHYWTDEYGWMDANGSRPKKHFIAAYSFDQANLITEVESAPALIPTLASYPNPFNPSTTLSFTLPQPGFIELSIYNLAGQKIRDLISDEMLAGTHDALWDGTNDRGKAVSSGIYISRLKAGAQVITNRMMLVK